MALSFCGKRLLLQKFAAPVVPVRHGYVVLLPEIGEDLSDTNPLLQQSGLPQFNNITIENCMAAIGKQTLDFENGIASVENYVSEKGSVDVAENVFKPLEKLNCALDTTWGISKTLYLGNSTLIPTKSYLNIHDRARQARTAKFNSLPIYNAVKTELDNNTGKRSEEESRMLSKFVLEGKLNGLKLSDSKKSELRETMRKLSEERNSMRDKINYVTKLFKMQITDPFVVSQLPVDLLKRMSPNYQNYKDGPFTLTLQPHIYSTFMEYCPDRTLRWNAWNALVTRGSGYGEKQLRTSLHIEEIRFLRLNQANLLGFDTYADMSMETKMAGSVRNVKLMLKELLEQAKPAQDREVEELFKFATENGFRGPHLELWDFPYWRRRHQEALYDFREETLTDYFPLPRVLDGLFHLCEQLFGIVIRCRQDVSTWHPDVKFFDIFESHTSAPIAGFYLDTYTRSDDKVRAPHENGWMVAIRNKSKVAETTPLAALVFNFEQPSDETPSLLTFKEVQLLFHKFGHALQHLLTQTNYSEVSGLSNVEWDMVESSGYVLSHWLYNKSTIDSITSHHQTGDKLPDDLFRAMVQTNKHYNGTNLCRDIYLSTLDLEIYSQKNYWLEIIRKLWPEYRNFTLEKTDSHPCNFLDIFTEEWAAAYYSNLWSRVIAADVYSAFHEGKHDKNQVAEVGKRFRDTFLALGGSASPNKVFRTFRGRDPCPKALLTSLGLNEMKTVEEPVLADA